MPGTLVVDERGVKSLAANAAVVAAFPFVRAVRHNRGGGCGGCGKSAKLVVYPSPQAVMKLLASLPPGRKREFKRLAGVDGVTGTVVRAARVIRESF